MCCGNRATQSHCAEIPPARLCCAPAQSCKEKGGSTAGRGTTMAQSRDVPCGHGAAQTQGAQGADVSAGTHPALTAGGAVLRFVPPRRSPRARCTALGGQGWSLRAGCLRGGREAPRCRAQGWAVKQEPIMPAGSSALESAVLLPKRRARKLKMLRCSVFPPVTLGAKQSAIVGGTKPAPGSCESSGAAELQPGLIYTCSCSPPAPAGRSHAEMKGAINATSRVLETNLSVI